VLMSLPSIQSVRAGLWLPCSLFGESFLHPSRGRDARQRFRATVADCNDKISSDIDKLSHIWKIHFHLFA